MNPFWLVQRVLRNKRHKGAITKLEHLRFDYMGSSEFELGAITAAYETMRKRLLMWTTVTVNAFNTTTTFHVIVPSLQITHLNQSLQAWFDGGFPGKEDPCLEPVVTRKGWRNEPLSDEDLERFPIAWWALQEMTFFTTDEGVARTWLASMKISEAALPEGVR